MISDITIDEDGNITTIAAPQTPQQSTKTSSLNPSSLTSKSSSISLLPLKDITNQQQSTSSSSSSSSTIKLKRGYTEFAESNHENSTEDSKLNNDNSNKNKKVHLISQYIDLSSTLGSDYLQTLFQLESKKPVTHGFLALQPEVTADMRTTLVDWMSDVVNWVPYNEETFFLAVSYVDRYLSVRGVRKGLLQLLGIAALHTAGKYEEVDPPSCTMLAPLAGKRESCKRVNLMELKIGVAIEFDYNVVTHLQVLKGITLFDEDKITTSSDIFTSAIVNLFYFIFYLFRFILFIYLFSLISIYFHYLFIYSIFVSCLYWSMTF